MGFLSRLRKAVRNLFHKSNIEAALGIEIAISSKMEEALQTWIEMFEDTPPWKIPEKGMETLNLPVSISSEIARLVTLEMKSTVSGSARADYINSQYQPVIDRARVFTEYACAKGGVALKPYISAGRVYVTAVQAEDFYPTTFDSDGEITGGVFTDYSYDEEYKYTRLEEHSLDGNVLHIKNKVYRLEISEITTSKDALGDEVSLTDVPDWASIQPEVTIDNVERTLFAYYKMPFANNIEPRSPLGVSVFSKAVDQIRLADKHWSEVLWEYEAGEAALNVSSNLFRRDENGDPVLPKGRERLYQTFDFDKEQKIDQYNPAFRDSSLFNGLNRHFQRIEFLCGLAYGTISDPTVVEKTATEIKTAKQRSYSTVSDIQKSLQKALEHLVYAMDTLATLYDLAPKGDYEVTFEFDDSIIVDAEAERIRDQQEVRDGLMQKWEYRVKWYGETEEKAKQMVGDDGQKSDEEILGLITEPEPTEGATPGNGE